MRSGTGQVLAEDAEGLVDHHRVAMMTSGQAALIELMNRYLKALLDPFVTLLEVHKLMYFMQAAGQPLKLRFAKAPYGPYAENLRRVLNDMEGHYTSGYADGRDAPNKQMDILPGAVERAAVVLRGWPTTQERLDRVADLVSGFESAFGLELLSTVHWVLEHDGPASVAEVVAGTREWDERKSRFSPRQIALATEVLTDKGWS